jgi:hypothetical protein
MLPFSSNSRLGRGLLLAAVVASASAFAVPALAGECPADQKKANAREAVDLKPVGVTDIVIASIDVSKAPFNIDGRNFRMRKLTVEPGGIVPWHSHADRPAIIALRPLRLGGLRRRHRRVAAHCGAARCSPQGADDAGGDAA